MPLTPSSMPCPFGAAVVAVFRLGRGRLTHKAAGAGEGASALEMQAFRNV